MESRLTRLEVEFEHVRKDLDDIKVDLKALPSTLHAQIASIQSDNRTTRWSVIATAVAVAALAIAIWQVGIAQQANLLSAFQTGLAKQQALQNK